MMIHTKGPVRADDTGTSHTLAHDPNPIAWSVPAHNLLG